MVCGSHEWFLCIWVVSTVCAHGKNFTVEIAEDAEGEVVLWEKVVLRGESFGILFFGVWACCGCARAGGDAG